jgi:hypothetical protein
MSDLACTRQAKRDSSTQANASGLIGVIVLRTTESTCDTSEIAPLSKLVTAITLAWEPDTTAEFIKARIRMEVVESLIHSEIRQ